MITVEQTVDFLVTNAKCRRFLVRSDLKQLEDMRFKIWLSGNPITQAQQTLISKLVSKYLMFLNQEGWPVQDLATPNWSTPVRNYTHTNEWSIQLDRASDRWIIKFPYHKPTIHILREIGSSDSMYDAVEWRGDEFVWAVENGSQGRCLLRMLLEKNSQWYCTLKDREALNVAESKVPVISFINGQWQHQHADESLGHELDRIIGLELSPLQTAMQLSEYAVTFDFRAKNYLKNWLKPVQVQMLCELDPIIPISQLPELTDLMIKVDTWPAVVVQNRWDPDNQIVFDFPDIPKYSHWTYEKSRSGQRTMDSKLFKKLIKETTPAVLEFPLGYTKELRLDNDVRIPWLIRSPGIVEQYSLIQLDSYIRHNYNKHIRVVPDSLL